MSLQHTSFVPKPLAIGSVLIDPPLLLAPMAGVTDGDYRWLMAQYGAGLVTTEMVSAVGLVRRQPETLDIVRQEAPLQVPLAVQIFGGDPAVMADAARILADAGVALIDINAGCPVKKVIRQGAGASLLIEPDRLASIVEGVKRAAGVPVTVKIRLGWDAQSINAVEVARKVESAGADAISVHGRTAVQFYGGRADWETIRLVKAAVSIPVIGNGDVTSPKEAEALLRETGCDGVMVGRATQGNPWTLAAMARRWGGGPCWETPPGWRDFLETVVTHIEAFLRRKPRAVGNSRQLLVWYSRGIPGSSRLRGSLCHLPATVDALTLFREWVEEVDARGVDFLSLKVSESP